MINLLMTKAMRLLVLLLILALTLLSLAAYSAVNGDGHMIVYFTMALLAYLGWGAFRVLRFLWFKVRGGRGRQVSSDESLRPALWLSPRTLRTNRIAMAHDSRGMLGSSKSRKHTSMSGFSLSSRKYTQNAGGVQVGNRKPRRGRSS